MSEILFEKQLPIGHYRVYSSSPDIPIKYPTQVHGSEVLQVGSFNMGEHPEADGVCAESRQTESLAVQTADCLPIVVIGGKGHALLHAGWRGIKARIHTSLAVQSIEPIYFFIGPSIQVDAFEVQSDFKAEFPDSEHFKEADGKLFFNLQAQVAGDLESLFSTVVVDSCGICTYSDPKFHSYRSNQTEERNWNVYLPSGA